MYKHGNLRKSGGNLPKHGGNETFFRNGGMDRKTKIEKENFKFVGHGLKRSSLINFGG